MDDFSNVLNVLKKIGRVGVLNNRTQIPDSQLPQQGASSAISGLTGLLIYWDTFSTLLYLLPKSTPFPPPQKKKNNNQTTPLMQLLLESNVIVNSNRVV